MSSLYTKMASFKNQLCPLVWLLVICLINHMLCLEDITHHKLFKVKKVFLHLKVNQTITNQALEAGPQIQKTSFMEENLFITKDQPKLIQLLLILVARLLQYLKMSTKLLKINGETIWAILIVKQMLLSVKLEDLVRKLLDLLSLLCLILKIQYSK